MAIDLTCPEKCFQADSVENFFLEMKSNPRMSKKMPKLTDVIREICLSVKYEPENTLLSCASKLNLFTVITGKCIIRTMLARKVIHANIHCSALHSLVFYQRMSFITLPFATAPLYNALDNWTKAWNFNILHSCDIPPPIEPWKADGFMHHAEEFALLARAHLDHAAFIGSQPLGVALTLPPVVSQESIDGLSKLDETSMNQVRNLMLLSDALNM